MGGRSCLDVGPALLVMVLVGPANFILYKVVFVVYGESCAFFVSQGINFLYVVYGGVLLYPRQCRELCRRRQHVALSSSSKQGPFVLMAMLDCLGTFAAAMGAVATKGQLQLLLNQSLVPCTMLASRIFLGTRYTVAQTAGASVIVLGAVVVVASPSDDDDTAQSSRSSFAALLYWGSNLPMACSAVYKEHRFAGDEVDVLYLTQQVSIYQLLFGFCLAPLQMFPGVATDKGLGPTELLVNFASGFKRFGLGGPECWLLLLYVLANFILNTTGLFVNKHAGAALTAIAYSLLLPITTLAYAAPILGRFREELRLSTVAGLFLVLLGFFVYESETILKATQKPPIVTAISPPPATRDDLPLLDDADAQLRRDKSIESFQERLVLVKVQKLPSTRRASVSDNNSQWMSQVHSGALL